ncbi:8-oxo-dGTP pyrophosphatase MutT (NUDIX family) [Amaricoccus macauensis]|uniref:8-oxo-dGTP pyrophosphatase MutT (NUDIX family) n=1 Tax=Amaricoccus macauensis TaxID=57001 RepID=A0A840SHY5_9RHOB|nr:CoA pyrophosphatase [Amaricoccus macauensis]MBB5220554.1 8-oxo-dGTP pyrophosphatase MutT (NUDIX family) [Amaricoccus macauensis]
MDRPLLNPSEIERALGTPALASSDYDLNPTVRRPDRPLRSASVLIPLVERGPGLNLVLTRRAARLTHHPGQIAFPGGKQDPTDASPLATALREANEEIGLDPSGVEVLGALDFHETVTFFNISPFVGLVPSDFRPVSDPGEVAEVFEVPLEFVLDPANLQIHRRQWQGQWRAYYAIPYGPHYIWGATARMLKALADRLQAP